MDHKSILIIGILVCTIAPGCGQTRGPVTALDEAKQFLFKDDFDAAHAKCDALLAADPKDFEAMLLRGQIYEEQLNDDAAMRAFNAAIELNPTASAPYAFRRDLLVNFAKETTDDDRKRELTELAAADQAEMERNDPNAFRLSQNEGRNPKKAISNKPIPHYQEPDKQHADFGGLEEQVNHTELAANEDLKSKKAKKAESGTQDQTPDTEKLVETAADFADRRRDEETIRDKDLHDEWTDPVLPPHLDPIAEPLSSRPNTAITTFSLPSPTEGSPLLPPTRGSVTTGLTRPNDADGEARDDQEPAGPRGRFFLQNQFGATTPSGTGYPAQQGVRTGIGNSRSNSKLRANQPLSLLQGGLLPADARESLGPRLGPLAGQRGLADSRTWPFENQNSEENDPAALPQGTPILTTARPGTTQLYGVPSGLPQGGMGPLSTARGNTSSRTRNTNRLGPSIANPKFTPFGQRPAKFSTPTLPPLRTSN